MTCRNLTAYMCTDTFSISGVICASWLVVSEYVSSKIHSADTFKALDEQDNLIGVIVCKLEPHRGGPMRGYIAMLATRKDYRGHGIATSLVKMAVEKMIAEDADEVMSPCLSQRDPECCSQLSQDRPRNRSRQHPLAAHLRKPGLHPHQAPTPLLLEWQHGLQTYLVLEAWHREQANVSARLRDARVRSGRCARRPRSDAGGSSRATSGADANRGCIWREV